MAKSFFSIAILFLVLQLSAQVEFAPLGATWVYNVGTNMEELENDPLENYFELISEEDVDIDGTTYRKVGDYYFFQDGHEVYYLWEGEHRLVYKFDMEVGDSATFQLLSCFNEKLDLVLTLKEIETVNINGEELRRFFFEEEMFLENDYVYTEKYGSERVIVENTVECVTIPGADFPWLRCFIEDDMAYKSQKFLQLGGEDCYYSRPMSVNDYKNVDIKFYPNPALDYLYISGGINMPNEFQVEILSLEGKVVLSHKIYNSEAKLDLSGLNSGIYIIQLNDLNGKSITTKKINITSS